MGYGVGVKKSSSRGRDSALTHEKKAYEEDLVPIKEPTGILSQGSGEGKEHGSPGPVVQGGDQEHVDFGKKRTVQGGEVSGVKEGVEGGKKGPRKSSIHRLGQIEMNRGKREGEGERSMGGSAHQKLWEIYRDSEKSFY